MKMGNRLIGISVFLIGVCSATAFALPIGPRPSQRAAQRLHEAYAGGACDSHLNPAVYRAVIYSCPEGLSRDDIDGTAQAISDYLENSGEYGDVDWEISVDDIFPENPIIIVFHDYEE